MGAHRSVLTACCGKKETYHHLYISLYLWWILRSEQTDPRLFSPAPLRKWRTYSLQTERRTDYNFNFFFKLFLSEFVTFTVFFFLLASAEFWHPPCTMADNKHPHVIFCNDSPKRVLVSVIKTTPIKPRKAEALTPTSPGFSDFMVYPWKWGENAHNVTLSPGSVSGASSPTGTQTATDADTSPTPEQIRVGLFFYLNRCDWHMSLHRLSCRLTRVTPVQLEDVDNAVINKQHNMYKL